MKKLILAAAVIACSAAATLSYASVSERVKAAGSNLQGSTQEAIGEMTDNPKLKAKGKLNKAEGALRNKKEDVKDAIKDKLD